MTDRSLRGYPSLAASSLVRAVLSQEPQSLERLPASLEDLRGDYALTRAEALDALSRGLAWSDSLPAAVRRTGDDKQRRWLGWSDSAGGHRGPDGGPGNSARPRVHAADRRPPSGRRW